MPFRFDLQAKTPTRTGRFEFFSKPPVECRTSLKEIVQEINAETNPTLKLLKLINVMQRYLKEKNVDLKLHCLFKKLKRVDQAKIEGATYLLTQLNCVLKSNNTDEIEAIQKAIYVKLNTNQTDLMWQGKEETRRLVSLYLTAIDTIALLKNTNGYSCSGATT